jgi:serine/threonine protein kinase
VQAAAKETPSARIGRYALIRRIAVGGMAEVFEASDPQCDERVVIKLLLPDLCGDDDVLQMFADEAHLSTQLSHDNLVRTRDAGQLHGRPYLVMELVDGCTLATLTQCSGALSPALAGRIALDVLRALDYMHQYCDADGQWLHIVHRDINPRNVLLSRDGAVKLADFGIARSRMRAARTRSGVIKGTVQYMSPEQITGSDLDQRSDLYSVGLLLFEMLTGRPYIEGAQEIDLLRIAESPSWRPPSKVKPGLAEAFDELLEPALMRFPEQRYRNASAFEQALEQALSLAEMGPATARQLGECVAALPARSGTIPPTAPAIAVASSPPAARPVGDGAGLKPQAATRNAGHAERSRSRRLLWSIAVGLPALALAGIAFWQPRHEAPAPEAPGLTAQQPPAADRSPLATGQQRVPDQATNSRARTVHARTVSATPVENATPTATTNSGEDPRSPGETPERSDASSTRDRLSSRSTSEPSAASTTRGRSAAAPGQATAPSSDPRLKKPRRLDSRAVAPVKPGHRTKNERDAASRRKSAPSRISLASTSPASTSKIVASARSGGRSRASGGQSPAADNDQAPGADDLAPLRARLSGIRSALRTRGILPADLPSELRRQLEQAAKAIAANNAERAETLLSAAERQRTDIRVDRAFVQRKLSRVDRALRQLPAERKDVQQLRQRSAYALQAFMDGDFQLANRQLNRLLKLLKQKEASDTP